MSDKYLYIYYSVLLFIMMSWTNLDAAPPMLLRLTFLGAVLYPGIKDKSLVPIGIICFWSLAVNGYAYSYMPTMTYLYTYVLIGFYLFFNKKNSKVPVVYWEWRFNIIASFYILLIDIITNSAIEPIAYSLIILCVLPLYINKIEDRHLNLFSIVFMVVTIVLSFYSLTTQEQFSGSYGEFEGIERSGWMDPNYLAMVVGMGALEGFYNIISRDKKGAIYIILGVGAFLIAIPAMLLVASRGAFTCLLGGISILIIFSNTHKKYKFLCILIAIGFVIYLYSNSYFDLMEARMEEDDGTGSNRTLIWNNKIMYFLHEGNVFNYLFGFGGFGGLTLGTGQIHGFHNDYIAFLVCYGIVGFLMFFYFLICSILKVNKSAGERFHVYANVFYVALASLTLEPIFFGNFHYYAFLFYTLLIAINSNKVVNCNRL